MTTAGEIRWSRVYFRCSQCTLGTFAADERLGVCGRYSPQSQRLICLAAASWSFDVASEHLEELCGMKVCDTTIRELSQEHGAKMSAWQRESFEAVQAFRETDGDIEFTTDGTCVNTTDGWREMKVGIFSKRHRGESAAPKDWEIRHLPTPHVRMAFTAIEKSSRFASRWRQWCRRLHIRDTSAVTVLADGAKWIWEEKLNHFRGAEGVLDIFHALEHISDAAKGVYGNGTDEAERFRETGRERLLEEGWPGIVAHLQATKTPIRSPRKRAALDALETYLRNHADHLHYPQRLSRGQSIGSGQVEGACKNLIGRRLKQTGARWRIRRVNRMAGLCSLLYSNNWIPYWNTLNT